MDRWKVTVDPVAAVTGSAVDDEEILDDDALDADPMIEDPPPDPPTGTGPLTRQTCRFPRTASR